MLAIMYFLACSYILACLYKTPGQLMNVFQKVLWLMIFLSLPHLTQREFKVKIPDPTYVRQKS